MGNHPSVSWRCATYKRLNFLDGIAQMFLDQDYEGEKEFVFLNDDPEVEIKCGHDEIRIFNLKQRLENMREKEAKAVELCRNEIIIPIDDDDYYAPWTIKTCVELIGNDEFCAPVGFIKQGGQVTQYHSQAIAGMYIIRKSTWDRIGGSPLYNPKSLLTGEMKQGSNTAFFKKLKRLGLYKEKGLNRDQAYFTWRPALAKSVWMENISSNPELFEPFMGTPDVYEILGEISAA